MNPPDPKAQLIERIRTIWAGNIVRHEMFDELASAWIEDRELHGVKQRLIELDLLEQAINQEREMPNYKLQRLAALLKKHDALTNKSNPGSN